MKKAVTKAITQQIPEYKSVEQRLESNILQPIAKEIYYFGREFYGSLASCFRIPTFIRKSENSQSPVFKYGRREEGNFSPVGLGFGIIAGIATIATVLANYFNNFENSVVSENLEYLGYTMLATNLLSGIYELGRLNRSRQEYSQLRESKLEQKSKEPAQTEKRSTKTRKK